MIYKRRKKINQICSLKKHQFVIPIDNFIGLNYQKLIKLIQDGRFDFFP